MLYPRELRRVTSKVFATAARQKKWAGKSVDKQLTQKL